LAWNELNRKKGKSWKTGKSRKNRGVRGHLRLI
jgi:hypothetical protein